MLEATILDNTEQLVAGALPTIRNITNKYVVVGDGSVAGSTAEFIKQHMNISTLNATTLPTSNRGPNGNALMPQYFVGKFFMTAGDNSLASGIGMMSFDPTTETFTTEDTTRYYDMIADDGSGVIWGVSNKAGSYGLWKRTGTATWTNMLSDAGATGYLAKWSNGSLYYRSSTGNWYILANGSATLTVDPGTSYAGWYSAAQNKTGHLYRGYKTNPLSDYPENLNDTSAYDGNTGADAMWVWKFPDKTRVMRKSVRLYEERAKISNQRYTQWIPVAGSNYWLQILCNQMAGTSTTAAYMEYTVVLNNFTTAQDQYLGQFRIPVIGSSWAGQFSTSYNACFAPDFAIMNNGVIRLYSLGQILSNGQFTNMGYVRSDIDARIFI